MALHAVLATRRQLDDVVIGDAGERHAVSREPAAFEIEFVDQMHEEHERRTSAMPLIDQANINILEQKSQSSSTTML